MTKILNDKQIKELIKAHVEYKIAENRFRRVKESLTKDLIPGKYESEKYGYVLKSASKRTYLDTEAILKDYPQINPEEYTREREVISVTVQNYNK